MKRWIHAATEDDYYEKYQEAESTYDQGDFMGTEMDVIDELGLYIDFSGVRFSTGPIWILSDTDHENNSDMWEGDLDDALVEMDFGMYKYDVITKVLLEDESKWRELYKNYLKSLIQGGK